MHNNYAAAEYTILEASENTIDSYSLFDLLALNLGTCALNPVIFLTISIYLVVSAVSNGIPQMVFLGHMSRINVLAVTNNGARTIGSKVDARAFSGVRFLDSTFDAFMGA